MYKQFRQDTTSVTLSNGYPIPLVGLGTWQSDKGLVEEAVKVAIETGYRHIDCGLVYGNEVEVGRGITAKIEDGTVTRDQLFITGKLWNTQHPPHLARQGLHQSLADLQLDYLDLYLIHWPVSLKEGDDPFPMDESGTKGAFSDAGFMGAYKEMEKMVDEGLVRSIGVSNFNRRQIQEILNTCRIKPVMNQVECHPYFNQQRLVDYCRENDMTVTAFSPFSSPVRPWAKDTDPKLTTDPRVIEIAKSHGKTVNQVLVRYQMQRGVPVLPKSVTPSRIEENFDVMDFKLSFGNMATLNGMECFRACDLEIWHDSKEYPFHEDF